MEYPRNSGDYELVGEPIGKGGSAMVIFSYMMHNVFSETGGRSYDKHG